MAEKTKQWDQWLQHATISDVGMRRTSNQDSYRVSLAPDDESLRRRGHLFLVADGMGAHAAGELASKIAADTVPFLYRKYREESPPDALRRAVAETNAEVHRRGQANPDFHNMGTTCSVLALLPQGALAAHVGDSRVYRLRGNVLEQLTFDHSLVWEMRAAGHLADGSEAASRLPKNVITRSLGPNPSVEVDVEGPFDVQEGDTFLLCSDGLTGQVPDEELGPVLANLPPDDAVRFLVDLANLRGGPDNVTILVAKVIGGELVVGDGGAAGRTLRSRAIHPAIWAISGAFLLAAIVLAVISQYLLAAISAAVAVFGLAVGLWRTYGPAAATPAPGSPRRMGQGPYTQTPCTKTAQLVERLQGTMEELRQAAVEEKWSIRWAPIDQHCAAAEKAVAARNPGRAIGELAHAISAMMKELREQRRKGRSSDSGVDLV
ncbi:MAG: protein phosphatase 2C domain-containing protein [Planctomycetes bacterium]|nr:protein phosphatase 2C domain-containing protein [Planctomycetota bacterium]